MATRYFTTKPTALHGHLPAPHSNKNAHTTPQTIHTTPTTTTHASPQTKTPLTPHRTLSRISYAKANHLDTTWVLLLVLIKPALIMRQDVVRLRKAPPSSDSGVVSGGVHELGRARGVGGVGSFSRPGRAIGRRLV
jgi:hypothetical protein